MPIADTDPATPIPDTVRDRGRHVRPRSPSAPGFGHQRLSVVAKAGQDGYVDLRLSRNLASTASGATVTGDGVNLDRIGDDTEATDWASLDGVAGRQVTVALRRRPRRRRSSGSTSARCCARRSPATPTPARRTRSARCARSRCPACNATTTDCADPTPLAARSTPARRRVPRRGVPAVRAATQPADVPRARPPSPPTCGSRCWPASAPAARATRVSRTTTRPRRPTARPPARPATQVRIAEFQAFAK